MNEFLVYDCEIKRAIPDKGQVLDIEYCKGWSDYEGMGISVIGWYDNRNQTYGVYFENELDVFQEHFRSMEYVVGFNSLCFDTPLLVTHGCSIDEVLQYDIMDSVLQGFGRRYSLNDLAEKNCGLEKEEQSVNIPLLWQSGKKSQVINHCLRDVRLTLALYEEILMTGELIRPDGSDVCYMMEPQW